MIVLLLQLFCVTTGDSGDIIVRLALTISPLFHEYNLRRIEFRTTTSCL